MPLFMEIAFGIWIAVFVPVASFVAIAVLWKCCAIVSKKDKPIEWLLRILFFLFLAVLSFGVLVDLWEISQR